MERAINEFRAVQSRGEIPCLRTVARACSVPKSTLQRRVKDKVTGNKHASGRPTVLGEQAEDDLASVLCLCAARGFPLSEKQVRDLATEYVNKKGMVVFFSKEGE